MYILRNITQVTGPEWITLHALNSASNEELMGSGRYRVGKDHLENLNSLDVKMMLKRSLVGYKSVDCCHVVQDRVQWSFLVNALMNQRFPLRASNLTKKQLAP